MDTPADRVTIETQWLLDVLTNYQVLADVLAQYVTGIEDMSRALRAANAPAATGVILQLEGSSPRARHIAEDARVQADGWVQQVHAGAAWRSIDAIHSPTSTTAH